MYKAGNVWYDKYTCGLEEMIFQSNISQEKSAIMKRKHRIAAALTAFLMLLTGFPATQAEAVQFTDISGHWAENYIIQATDLGLFSGVTATRFDPDGTMTRAMFVTVLASCSGENTDGYTTSHFRDVSKNAWYASAVAWAYQKGIVSGTSSTAFSPNQAISREQLASLLIRFANYQGCVLPRVKQTVLFSDSSKCADYALDAVITLYRADIVNGIGNSKFDPKGDATRAEVAVILCKYVDAVWNNCPSNERVSLVSHRGYNASAPENTMPAFALSVQKGYQYIETDVQFTSDGIPVLLHDSTIDRTSNGSGKVADMTYKTLQTYDFSYVDGSDYSAYRGTKIPTYEEFIAFCAENDVHPFIELKSTMTADQVKTLVNIAVQYGMQYNITWISFTYENLKYAKSYSPTSTLCLLTNSVTSTNLTNCNALKNGTNAVLLGVEYRGFTAAKRASCLRKNVDFCVWTVDAAADGVNQANTCAEFITTNCLTSSDLYQ